jgi:hypothetical protein
MLLQHSIEIDRPIDELFDFVADARNDPRWCPRVKWCEQVGGDGPEVGARYEAYERPSLRKHQRRWIEVVTNERPTRLVTRQTDEQGDFTIEYVLDRTDSGTRLTQRDSVTWTLPRLIVPIAKRIVDRHIREQLGGLKRLLETAERG